MCVTWGRHDRVGGARTGSRRVVSTSRDDTLRIWDGAKGLQQLVSIKHYNNTGAGSPASLQHAEWPATYIWSNQGQRLCCSGSCGPCYDGGRAASMLVLGALVAAASGWFACLAWCACSAYLSKGPAASGKDPSGLIRCSTPGSWRACFGIKEGCAWQGGGCLPSGQPGAPQATALLSAT